MPKKKTKKIKKTLRELIILRFSNISNASVLLNLTRRSVYKFMKANKITTRAKNTIIAAGYSPKTFRKLTH